MKYTTLLFFTMIISSSMRAQESVKAHTEQEKIFGKAMIAGIDQQNWIEFGKNYAHYYETAFDHSAYHINNISWPIFEHITDTAILDVAIKTMKYSIENFDQTNYQAYDTYANLLYKRGRVKEAIEWEEKAAKALPDEKWPIETLEKMRKGIPTWVTEPEKAN